jgi:hypothetical protein
MDNEIIITSNGSKWYGQDPDSIEILKERLKKYDLDICQFAVYGFVDYLQNGNCRILGNFSQISAVFNIEGPEHQMLVLVDLIKKNINKQFDKNLKHIERTVTYE